MYMMHRILLFLFLFCSTTVFAQQQPPTILSNEDTTAMHDALNPETMHLNTKDDKAIKDSLTKAGYALKRLKDVINMKKNILWSTDLSKAIRDFQDTTFVLISPLMKVEGQGVLIGLVSRVGEINLFDPIDPYVNIYWVINPVTELEDPFKLTLHIEHSTMLPEELFTDITLAIQTYYANKVYQNVAETQEDIITATIDFLNLLKAKVGDTYAPKYVFKVGGNEYRSGHSMSMYKQAANQVDTVVAIYLIDRITKQIVQQGITWTGADVQAYHAFVDKVSMGTHVITAHIDNLDYQFTLIIIGDDVIHVISQSIVSVFEAALIDAMQVLVDSAKAKENAYQEQKVIRDDLRKQMIAKHVQVAGTGTAANYSSVYVSDSTTFISEPLPTNIRTHSFLGQYINKATAEHLARVAFIFAWTNRQVLLELTSDASKQAAFKNAVMNDIGTLAAEITIALITADETTIKQFLINFIVSKVNATTTAQLNTK